MEAVTPEAGLMVSVLTVEAVAFALMVIGKVSDVLYVLSIRLNTTGPPKQLLLYAFTAAVKVG
jgi:hypothetical protein